MFTSTLNPLTEAVQSGETLSMSGIRITIGVWIVLAELLLMGSSSE